MRLKAERVTMRLTGVCDPATRRAATTVLRALPGVRSVSIHEDSAWVTFYPDKTTVSQMTEALDCAGFSVV